MLLSREHGNPSGFYLTYKELKRIEKALDLATFISFYLTYKELKPALFFPTCSVVSPVFILPIRNWNNSSEAALQAASRGFYLTYKELKLNTSGTNPLL